MDERQEIIDLLPGRRPRVAGPIPSTVRSANPPRRRPNLPNSKQESVVGFVLLAEHAQQGAATARRSGPGPCSLGNHDQGSTLSPCWSGVEIARDASSSDVCMVPVKWQGKERLG